MKAALMLMAILTVIYVVTTVYADVDDPYRYVVYAAFKYELDTPPTKWYTPEELGIVDIREIDSYEAQIVVDREKEPFPFGPHGTDDQPTRFLYKGKFYTVSSRWVTFDYEHGNQWQIPISGTLALGSVSVFTGALFLKRRRNKECERRHQLC